MPPPFAIFACAPIGYVVTLEHLTVVVIRGIAEMGLFTGACTDRSGGSAARTGGSDGKSVGVTLVGAALGNGRTTPSVGACPHAALVALTGSTAVRNLSPACTGAVTSIVPAACFTVIARDLWPVEGACPFSVAIPGCSATSRRLWLALVLGVRVCRIGCADTFATPQVASTARAGAFVVATKAVDAWKPATVFALGLGSTRHIGYVPLDIGCGVAGIGPSSICCRVAAPSTRIATNARVGRAIFRLGGATVCTAGHQSNDCHGDEEKGAMRCHRVATHGVSERHERLDRKHLVQ